MYTEVPTREPTDSLLCRIPNAAAPKCSLLLRDPPYRRRDERVRKNSAGVAIRIPVRFATASVKCLVLWVNGQSGLLAIAERSTGTSAAS
jgi:hypothetical protein